MSQVSELHCQCFCRCNINRWRDEDIQGDFQICKYITFCLGLLLLCIFLLLPHLRLINFSHYTSLKTPSYANKKLISLYTNLFCIIFCPIYRLLKILISDSKSCMNSNSHLSLSHTHILRPLIHLISLFPWNPFSNSYVDI